VAEERSVTRAAARLHISQPALSAKIGVLERTVGRRLFVRRGHGVELSEAGEVFLAYTESALRLLEDGLDAVRTTGSTPSSVAIGCTPSISLSCMSAVLGRFGKLHPHIGVTVRSASSAAVYELLLARIIQLAVIVRDLHAKGLERVILGTDPILLVAAPSHSLAQRSEIALDELAGQRLILAEWGTGYDTLVEYIHHRRIDPPPTRVQLDPTHAARTMVEQGLGLSFLPHLVVRECLQNGTLRVIGVPELPQMRRQIVAVFHRHSKLPPLASMIDALEAVLQEFALDRQPQKDSR
jgi:DNA-binding transcriptional LysR family regulator